MQAYFLDQSSPGLHLASFEPIFAEKDELLEEFVNHGSECCRLGKDVSLQSFQNASHLGLLQDQRVIDVVVKLLKKHSSKAAFDDFKNVGENWWSSALQPLWMQSATPKDS